MAVTQTKYKNVHDPSPQQCRMCRNQIPGSDETPRKPPALCEECATSIAEQIQPFLASSD